VFALLLGLKLCLNFFLSFIFHGLNFLTSSFLLSIGIHKVTIHDVRSCSHTLNRYYAKWNKPRPESSTIVCPSLQLKCLSIRYVVCINCGEHGRSNLLVVLISQDKESASNISSISAKQHFYREVASAAESGWDFSTRWMR
jgi:alpha,alpha-trehalase